MLLATIICMTTIRDKNQAKASETRHLNQTLSPTTDLPIDIPKYKPFYVSKLNEISEVLTEDRLGESLRLKNNFLMRKYLNETGSDLIYIEMIYSLVEQNNTRNISQIQFEVFWFLNSTPTYFKREGFFVGVGQSAVDQQHDQIANDLLICKINSQIGLKRCDDYHFKANMHNPLEWHFRQNFFPLLDHHRHGFDSILKFEIHDLITEYIKDYDALIRFRLSVPLTAYEETDLDFSFLNNLTVFYGQYGNEDYDDAHSKAVRNPRLIVDDMKTVEIYELYGLISSSVFPAVGIIFLVMGAFN